MKSTEDMIHEGKAQWTKVKTEVEQLGVQLALGRNEAKDAFEREWKKFSGFLDEQTHRLRRRSSWAAHLLKELEQHTRALKDVLQQIVPNNEKAFNTWREQVLRNVYELEFIIGELYPVLETDEKELMSSFRIKMEVYRTRLIMLHEGEVASLGNQALQLVEKIKEVLVWRERDTEFAREKMQRFGEDLSASFDHMKQAFNGLFK